MGIACARTLLRIAASLTFVLGCFLAAAVAQTFTIREVPPQRPIAAEERFAVVPLPPVDRTAEPAEWPATATETPAVSSDEAVTGEAEGLDEAWQTALTCDQRLKASQCNLSAAQKTQSAAMAERLPEMTLGADYLALSQTPSFTANIAPLPTQHIPFFEQNSVGFAGLVTQPLYTSGRITSGIEAASANIQANQAQVCQTRLDIKMNVAEAYVSVLRAGRLKQAADSRVSSLTSHNRDVAMQFDKGIVKRNDLLASQVALANAKQQALQLANSLETAKAGYNRALGRPLTAPVRLADLKEQTAMGDCDDLTRTALQMRPELLELAAQARGLREQSEEQRAKNGPQVALTGGYVYQSNKYINPNGEALLAVGVQWKALDLGRNRYRADAYSDKADALCRLRRDTESMISLEVRQKWLALQTALEQVPVAKQAVAQSEENLRVSRDRYQNQVGTNTEVLDAETLRIQAYSNFYNSTYEAVLARLRLCRAVGDL